MGEKTRKKLENCKKMAFSRKKGKKLIQIEAKRYRKRCTDSMVGGQTKKKKKYFQRTTDRQKRTCGTRLMLKIFRKKNFLENKTRKHRKAEQRLIILKITSLNMVKRAVVLYLFLQDCQSRLVFL